MEVVKKFQGSFRRAREQLNQWDELQSCLISRFRSASHIIDRLQVLQNSNCYGGLNCDSNVRDALVVNQIKSLDNILVSMRSTFASDLGALQQLLVDQPNVLSEEVKYVFDIIFAEELC